MIARAFEKVVYQTHARKAVEECLTPTQFAYRQGGNCTNALISIQHHVYKYLDNQDCKAVRIFTMDFSKAFDSVNHCLLSAKLRQLPLNPYIVNWYHSFLDERQQRVSSGSHVCTWQAVNKGTTQGSVSGPYLFNVFLNDLNIFHNDVPVLFKYTDDSTILAPVNTNFDPSDRLVGLFLNWSRENNMICNPSKCKELVVRKKNNNTQYEQICNIPQCNSLSLLGVTLQSNCKFSEHVRLKLLKANRCLHVLRSLRKEQYSQVEIDHLFKSLILPNFTYYLSAYGASESDLNMIQPFLDRCHKRRFVSSPVSIKDVLCTQDCKILKAITSVDNHPLGSYLPPKKENEYNLRKKQCALPKVNTERFKTSYVNRLIFKHKIM